MHSRADLQDMLESILGSKNVYYQPPASIQMKYPAIVFFRNRIENKHADNKPYTQAISYDVTVIDKSPDNDVIFKLSKLPQCRYDRHYIADNLHHDVFTLYY